MRTALLPLVLLVAGCATTVPADPQDAFFERLLSLCGRSYEGQIVSPPVEADASFAGRRLVMHVRDCSPTEVRVPFHVGDDRSRTWVISRSGTGLRLKHDHRHEDGSEDRLTQYGGDSAHAGTHGRQEFPADEFSMRMFVRENVTQSQSNVWAIEVEPKTLFAYELRRPGRYFRVEFDLTRPVAPPPPAWGHG